MSVVILCAPAVLGFPVGLGHPDTHRTRTDSTSPLAAIVLRHTGGRDAVWHGPPGTGAASVPKAHQVSWGRELSSRDIMGVCAAPRRECAGCSCRPALPACR